MSAKWTSGEEKAQAATELKFLIQQPDGCWFAAGPAGKIAVARFKMTKGSARNALAAVPARLESVGFVVADAQTFSLFIEESKFPKAQIALRAWLKVAGKTRKIELAGPLPDAPEDDEATADADQAAPVEDGLPDADEVSYTSDDEDDDDWQDADIPARPLSDHALGLVSETGKAIAEYRNRVGGPLPSERDAANNARVLNEYLTHYLPSDLDDPGRDLLAQHFLTRLFLRTRPRGPAFAGRNEHMGVLLDRVSAGPVTEDEIVQELSRDLESMASSRYQARTSAAFMNTERFQAWAKMVVGKDDRMAEIDRIKTTLATACGRSNADQLFGLTKADAARDTVRPIAYEVLRRTQDAKNTIDAAFAAYFSEFGADTDAAALAAQGRVMTMPPKAIIAQIAQVRTQVTQALDNIAEMAAAYPFTRTDPKPAISALMTMAEDNLTVRTDVLLSHKAYDAPISVGISSVLAAATRLTGA